ncbi:MAG: division/cell wall cluster transcriptional repressor MraZ [Novosphingobium sp.]|nr:division/cell wall cluster transcriptional repressor MraZ [Novosphingobium sp.]
MASQPYQYSGQDFSLLRDKGRFVLPALFRKIVKESSANKPVLCIDTHHRWPCLIGFGLSRAQTFDDLLEREEREAERKGLDFDWGLRETQLNSFRQVPFDDSGRFVLPAYLAELRDIGDQIFFQGSGKVVQLWSPMRLAEMGDGWENPQAACRQLATEAMAKGTK